MVLALVLAQLVLPGPPSEPLSPPGMICMGECSDGPMVWRASPARGRLVVACDMRSSTCSDGRTITTQRATPVPCETSPGVWEMVPEDTGCYGVRGLEAWAATTSYLSHGADLDRSPWGSVRGGTLQPVADGWQVSNDPSQSNSGWVYRGGAADEGVTYTVACRVRAETPTTLRVSPLDAGGSDCPLHQVGAKWATVSCTQTAGAGRGERAHIWPGVGQSGPASVIVAACWLTKSDTPGRPCWGGEAPVTCAADRHTISTEGWPTESGEISLVVELTEQLAAGRNAWLFDGRDAGDLVGVNPYIQPDGRLRFRVAGTVYGSASPMLTWEVGRPYALRFLREGGQTYIYRDGALVYSVATPDWAWVPSAHLGMNFSFPGPDIAMAIRSLTVRSYEEVSP